MENAPHVERVFASIPPDLIAGFSFGNAFARHRASQRLILGASVGAAFERAPLEKPSCLSTTSIASSFAERGAPAPPTHVAPHGAAIMRSGSPAEGAGHEGLIFEKRAPNFMTIVECENNAKRDGNADLMETADARARFPPSTRFLFDEWVDARFVRDVERKSKHAPEDFMT